MNTRRTFLAENCAGGATAAEAAAGALPAAFARGSNTPPPLFENAAGGLLMALCALMLFACCATGFCLAETGFSLTRRNGGTESETLRLSVAPCETVRV